MNRRRDEAVEAAEPTTRERSRCSRVNSLELRSSSIRAFGLIFALKIYVFALLYVLFLRNDLRNGDKGFFYRPQGQTMADRCEVVQENFWERLAPYDGQWYLDIARKGYRVLPEAESRRGTHPPGNYAFFPLLPAFLWGMTGVVGEGYLLAVSLLTIAALSALGAFVLWSIAREIRVNAWLSVLLLVAFPTAVFQFALYTEGVFLLFSASALLFALRRRLALAILFAALASLTRPQGVLLALPLFVEFVLPVLRGKERVARGALLGRLGAVASPFSGLLVMSLVSHGTTGSFLAFLSIQGRWGRSYESSSIFSALGELIGYGGPPMDALGLFFGAALLPVMWKRLPLSISLFGIGALLMPLSTGSIMSLGRFMSVSVPHFLALALFLDRFPPFVRGGVISAFAVCQVYVAAGLLAWYLVG